MIRKIELLAPARNVAIGIEAINSGADAVYIGGPAFGARSVATNSVKDIETLVNYAHRYGAKVYVTLNTILYDSELDDAKSIANNLIKIGVDAFIVQDFAYLKMGLSIPLHASTQMDNRTVEKVQLLHELGYEQVVLARELSLKEISDIHNKCPNVQLESFVHGSLCVSYSGKCYASQYCFGRSANRGECAQFCRLAFNLENRDGRVLLKNKYLLSLKDMNRSDCVEELLDAGVSSLKIEGRLKDVCYVKNVTAFYSNLLNEIIRNRPNDFRRSSYGECQIDFKPDLNKCFNRGYTHYFLKKKEDVCSFSTPKSKGEYVGFVKEIGKNYIVVSGVGRFSNGDGICFINESGKLEGIRVNRVENNKLFLYPFPKNLRTNNQVYRNKNFEFDKTLQKASSQRVIFIDVSIISTKNGFELNIKSDNGISRTLHLIEDKVLAHKSQIERIEHELSKSSVSYIKVRQVTVKFDNDYFIPASILGQWRKEILELYVQSLNNSNIAHKNCVEKRYKISDFKKNVDFTYNVSNQLAKEFYQNELGAKNIDPAFELIDLNTDKQRRVLMTCKHCIRFTLGVCTKNKKLMHNSDNYNLRMSDSLLLTLPNGKKFPLHFDCSKCEMQVLNK